MISETGAYRAGNRSIAGFTLIEMLVLIFIMAILSGAVVGAHLRHLKRVKFDQTVDHTLTIFAEARRMSVDSGFDVVVSVDQQGGVWTVQARHIAHG